MTNKERMKLSWIVSYPWWHLSERLWPRWSHPWSYSRWCLQRPPWFLGGPGSETIEDCFTLSVQNTFSCQDPGFSRQSSLQDTYWLHKTEKSLFIPLPFCVKLNLGREFVTAKLHSDLQAIGVQVVKVWHTCNTEKWQIALARCWEGLTENLCCVIFQTLGMGMGHYLTTSKAVPQCAIDDASGSVEGGPTPVCVVVGHGGVVVCVGSGQLLEDLCMERPLKKSTESKTEISSCLGKIPPSGVSFMLTCSSGVGENILSSWGCLEKSKG